MRGRICGPMQLVAAILGGTKIFIVSHATGSLFGLFVIVKTIYRSEFALCIKLMTRWAFTTYMLHVSEGNSQGICDLLVSVGFCPLLRTPICESLLAAWVTCLFLCEAICYEAIRHSFWREFSGDSIAVRVICVFVTFHDKFCVASVFLEQHTCYNAMIHMKFTQFLCERCIYFSMKRFVMHKYCTAISRTVPCSLKIPISIVFCHERDFTVR